MQAPLGSGQGPWVCWFCLQLLVVFLGLTAGFPPFRACFRFCVSVAVYLLTELSGNCPGRPGPLPWPPDLAQLSGQGTSVIRRYNRYVTSLYTDYIEVLPIYPGRQVELSREAKVVF